MIELRHGFDSFAAFKSWQRKRHGNLRLWVSSLIDDVRTHGLFEPLSNTYYEPRQITIDLNRLPVSLEAGGLNSRKRAGLLALQTAVASLPPQARQRPKILGAEGVTHAARVLRAVYPFYLSTEYLPSMDEQAHCYPIPHLDLMNIELPDESFDVFFSAHVLEHVPDVRRAVHEVTRVLKPGGFLVSTYPFDPNRIDTITKARMVAGKIEYLTEPELHGNPVRPSEGSLVFQLPGWDILDMCRTAGLVDAKLLLTASSRYGVVAHGSVGLFALLARKQMPGEAQCADRLEPIEYVGPYF